jgi:hypothetical protein
VLEASIRTKPDLDPEVLLRLRNAIVQWTTQRDNALSELVGDKLTADGADPWTVLNDAGEASQDAVDDPAGEITPADAPDAILSDPTQSPLRADGDPAGDPVGDGDQTGDPVGAGPG